MGRFSFLATSFGPRAVAIVLSGTGSDGTVGVQQVANEGGMTLAQEPSSAKFDSMPRSAMATGVIDHVLSPARMAEELLAYVGHVEHLVTEEAKSTGYDAIHQALPEPPMPWVTASGRNVPSRLLLNSSLGPSLLTVKTSRSPS